ncbi:flagellin [Paenibacillus sp. HMSSN-139]|nr:flagellin [Paenibacillus sp. HMSSN-139]
MIINHNLNAMNAHRNLQASNIAQGKSSEKLSSGYKVNRAADDAAGLSISEKMRTQIRALSQAQANVQDGISMVQTAEGAMNEVSDMLSRMKELAVKAANGTYNASDVAAINDEYKALGTAIDNVANKTTFNGITLLNQTGTKNIQMGDNSGDTITVTLADIKLSTLAVGTDASAAGAMGLIDTAIGKVNTARSAFGAVQNQMEHTSTTWALLRRTCSLLSPVSVTPIWQKK